MQAASLFDGLSFDVVKQFPQRDEDEEEEKAWQKEREKRRLQAEGRLRRSSDFLPKTPLVKRGHDARMMPPAYVKPYIRRQKNDASDAAAICEAVTRPSMRFVGLRSLKNQAALMRHRTREMLVSQRTQLFNGLRGLLTEVGVIAAQGPRHARELAELIEACDETIPLEVCEALAELVSSSG
jgi:hypothetical protein